MLINYYCKINHKRKQIGKLQLVNGEKLFLISLKVWMCRNFSWKLHTWIYLKIIWRSLMVFCVSTRLAYELMLRLTLFNFCLSSTDIFALGLRAYITSILIYSFPIINLDTSIPEVDFWERLESAIKVINFRRI